MVSHPVFPTRQSTIFSLVLHDTFKVKQLAVNLSWTLQLNTLVRNLKIRFRCFL